MDNLRLLLSPRLKLP